MFLKKSENKQHTVQQRAAANGKAKAGISRPAVSVFNTTQFKEPVTNSTTVQLRATKRVEASAQKHYADGWGVQYNITTDDTLKASVPDSVKGSGSIALGSFEKNRWVYRGTTYRNMKNCHISYNEGTDGWGKHKHKYTGIYHCGPAGVITQQHWDGHNWV